MSIKMTFCLRNEKTGGPPSALLAPEEFERLRAERRQKEEREKELERLRDRARRNEAAALVNAEKRGRMKVTKKLMDKGMSVEEAAEITGLTVDDILRLK